MVVIVRASRVFQNKVNIVVTKKECRASRHCEIILNISLRSEKMHRLTG